MFLVIDENMRLCLSIMVGMLPKSFNCIVCFGNSAYSRLSDDLTTLVKSENLMYRLSSDAFCIILLCWVKIQHKALTQKQSSNSSPMVSFHRRDFCLISIPLSCTIYHATYLLCILKHVVTISLFGLMFIHSHVHLCNGRTEQASSAPKSCPPFECG